MIKLPCTPTALVAARALRVPRPGRIAVGPSLHRYFAGRQRHQIQHVDGPGCGRCSAVVGARDSRVPIVAGAAAVDDSATVTHPRNSTLCVQLRLGGIAPQTDGGSRAARSICCMRTHHAVHFRLQARRLRRCRATGRSSPTSLSRLCAARTAQPLHRLGDGLSRCRRTRGGGQQRNEQLPAARRHGLAGCSC